MGEFEHAALIAKLESAVESMSRTLDKLHERVDAQTRQLTEIEHRIAEARGGMRVLIWLGSVTGVLLAALVTWAARHLQWQS